MRPQQRVTLWLRTCLFLLCVLPGAARADLRLLSLPTKDLVYDASRQRIYASVPSSGGARANSVTIINPETGEIGPSIAVAPNPGKLALSDDGRYLYVGLEAAGGIQRIDLESGRPDLHFTTAVGQTPADFLADMAVVPGSPQAVAVSLANFAGGFNGVAAAIFDNGVAREKFVPTQHSFGSIPSIKRLRFGAQPTRLYGLSTAGGMFIFRMNVDPTGVVLQDRFPPFLETDHNTQDFEYLNGLLYFNSGRVLDPESKSLLQGFGQFDLRTLVRPDPDSGRIFFLGDNYGSARFPFPLLAFELQSRRPVGRLDLPIFYDFASSLILWGRDGLAFRTDRDQVELLRTRRRRPDLRSVDLAVTGSVSANPAYVGEDLTFELTVRNYGPDTETGAVMRSVLPAWTSFISLTASQGRCTREGDQLTCELGALRSGARAVVRLVVKPTRGEVGRLRHTATVRGQVLDGQPGNNTATQRTEPAILWPCPPTGPQQPGGCPPVLGASFKRISLPTRDLVYDRVRRRIYASVPARAGAMGNHVVEIDPVSGDVISTIPVENEPGKLAVSDDGQYLYVALDALGQVRRIDLASRVGRIQFPLGPGPNGERLAALDMEVLPGDGEALAVLHAGQQGVAIYGENGFLRGGVAGNRFPAFTLTSLEPSPSAFRLYAFNGQSTEYGFHRFEVDDLGVRPLDEIRDLIRGFGVEIKSDQGLVFGSDGRVIDPEAGTLIGTVQGLSEGTLVAPDHAAGYVVYLTGDGPTRLLRVYSSQTFLPLGTIGIAGVSGNAGSLIRTGEEMLAFRTDGDQVFLVRLALLTPIDVTLAVDPAATVGGSAATGTVTLQNEALEGSATVLLMSENPALVTVPAAVVVPAGQKRATFPITTRAVGFTTDVGVTAAYFGATRTAPLRLLPAAPLLLSFTLGSEAVIGGSVATGIVGLTEPAPAGGRTIDLESANPAVASVPFQVVVPAGATTARFEIHTRPVSEPTRVVIRATGGSVRNAILWVLPVGLSLTPASVKAGQSITGTLVLPAPAPEGGAVVTLMSGNPAVASVPASITVPAGARMATFQIRTSAVIQSTRVTLTAEYGGVMWTRAVMVEP